MGFENKTSGGDFKFANFKEGKISTYENGQKVIYTHLSGDLVDMDIEDAEYNKVPYRKIALYIRHEDGLTQLGFPLGSGYGQAFIKLLPNIDPQFPIEVSGNLTPDPTPGSVKKFSSMFVSQNGKSLKWHFKKGTPEGDKFPLPKDITIGTGRNKKIVKDYTDRDIFCEKVFSHFFQSKLLKVYPVGVKSEFKKMAGKSPEETEIIDDLPF